MVIKKNAVLRMLEYAEEGKLVNISIPREHVRSTASLDLAHHKIAVLSDTLAVPVSALRGMDFANMVMSVNSVIPLSTNITQTM